MLLDTGTTPYRQQTGLESTFWIFGGEGFDASSGNGNRASQRPVEIPAVPVGEADTWLHKSEGAEIPSGSVGCTTHRKRVAGTG